MDIKALYHELKSNVMKFDSIDNINGKDSNGYTLLHFAALFNDMQFVRELMKRGIIYNSKTIDRRTPYHIATNIQVKNLFTTIRLFFKAAKEGTFHKVLEYITEERLLINVNEDGGNSVLHWAVYKGHQDIVKLLLQNNADIFQVTDEGNTPLHLAVLTGNEKIVEFLLKNISVDKLFKFINMQTVNNESSCLHVAADKGYLRIVLLLLQHGAVYKIKNKLGKAPLDLSRDEIVQRLLNRLDCLFGYAQNGDKKLFGELDRLGYDSVEALTKARNVDEMTLKEVAANNEEDYVIRLENFLKNHDQNFLRKGEWRFWELQALQYAAEKYYMYSVDHIAVLTKFSDSFAPDLSYILPGLKLKSGTLLLGHVYRLVDTYTKLRPGSIADENIQTINDTLDQLQFHENHISFDHNDKGQATCFSSKAQGSEYYYKLLHTQSRAQTNIFVELVLGSINIRIEKFWKSVEEKLLVFPGYRLIEAVKTNNISKVTKCLKKGVDVNFNNCKPLIFAVKHDNIDVLKLLLKSGANIQNVFTKGNTILHLLLAIHESSGTMHNMYSDRDTTFDVLMTKETPQRSMDANPTAEKLKCLLEFGAVYNQKNDQGETPLDIAVFPEARYLLQEIDTCFLNVKNKEPQVLRSLQKMNDSEFIAATRCRNSNGHTLLETAVKSGNTIKKRISKLMRIRTA